MQRSLSMSVSSPVHCAKIRKVGPKDLSPRTTQLLERSPFVHDVREYFAHNPVPTFHVNSESPLGQYFKKLVNGEITAKYEPRAVFPAVADFPLSSAKQESLSSMKEKPLDENKKYHVCVFDRTAPKDGSVEVNGSFARMYIPKHEKYGNVDNMIVDFFDRTAYSNMGANAFDIPVVFMENGELVEKKIEVKCVEEVFQLLKCFYCDNSKAVLEHIYEKSDTVKDIKKLGKVTQNFKRDEWNHVSFDVMLWAVLRACVGKDSYLFKLLCNVVRESLDCATRFGNHNVGFAEIYICETPDFEDATWGLGMPLDVSKILLEGLIQKGQLRKFEAMMMHPLQPMGPRQNIFESESKNYFGRILTTIARLMKGWYLDFEEDDSSLESYLLEKMQAFVKDVCPPMIFIKQSDDDDMEGVVQWPDMNESFCSSGAFLPRPGASAPVPYGVQQSMFLIRGGAPESPSKSPTSYYFKTPEPLVPLPKMLVPKEVHPGSARMG